MKKIIILVVLVTSLLVSCVSAEGTEVVETDGNYSIKTIDSCEYIEVDEGLIEYRIYSLTHKGNCKYCAQRNNK